MTTGNRKFRTFLTLATLFLAIVSAAGQDKRHNLQPPAGATAVEGTPRVRGSITYWGELRVVLGK